MIQATRETSFIAYINTEANRIDTNAKSNALRFLCKFTNDMTGGVFYCYPTVTTIVDRYTKLEFTYNAAPNFYNSEINLAKAGYYNYEVYEVSWLGAVTVSAGNAPATELDVLEPAANTKGIVNGLVAIGMLYQSEKSGSEEVQYKQNGGRVVTLDIAYGGAGYGVLAPALTVVGDSINPASASCTVSGGVVDTVTIIYAGNGYTTNPTVTLTSVGETAKANIVASIQEHNYIYTG